jgi:hypothetical protein
VEAETEDVETLRGRRPHGKDRGVVLARLQQLDLIRWALEEAEASVPDSSFELRGPAWLWQATIAALTLDAIEELEGAVRRLSSEGEKRGSNQAREAVDRAMTELTAWVPMATAIYEFPPAKRQRGEAM